MEPLIVTAAICFILVSAGFAVLLTRLFAQDRTAGFSDENGALFSPQRYKVMERLLDENDCHLFSQRSQGRSLERQFRLQRTRIFRGYLHHLSCDFRRVSKTVKLLMIGSAVDRPDLLRVLARQQFTFAVATVSVEYRLFLYRHNWAGVDAGRLTQSVRELCNQLQSVAALVEPAAA